MCHTPHASVVAFNANGEEKDLRLVLAVAYFVMVWIGKSERREVLRTHIVETAKRIYGAPEFFYYAHPCYKRKARGKENNPGALSTGLSAGARAGS